MRIALVGLGTAGCDIHLPALAGIQSASIVGLCDSDPRRRDRAAAMCGAPAFTDFDDMLAQTRADVVIVGTPPDSHADYCVRSLGAGAHVLCEKPMGLSAAEVEALAAAAWVAAWVASWVTTTWAPTGPRRAKTVGLITIAVGADMSREPSTVVVTAAMPG